MIIRLSAVCIALTAATAAQPRTSELSVGDVAQLVRDLEADDVRWNATRAVQTLQTHPDAARPLLMQALQSPDWQQRQYAFLVLATDSDCPITESMIQTAVEALRDDHMGSRARAADGSRETWDNAKAACDYLVGVGHVSEFELASALLSDDAQQRFLAAYCLGMMGSNIAVEHCAAELLPHLRDNDIDFDAVMAAPALYRLGPAVMPALLRARPGADQQQAELIDLLILDLTNPPSTHAELVERKGRQSITENYFDPAIQVHMHQMFRLPNP